MTGTCDKCHTQETRIWETKRWAVDGKRLKWDEVCTTCYMFLRDNSEERYAVADERVEEEADTVMHVPVTASAVASVLRQKPCRWCGKAKPPGLCPHCGKDGRTFSKKKMLASFEAGERRPPKRRIERRPISVSELPPTSDNYLIEPCLKCGSRVHPGGVCFEIEATPFTKPEEQSLDTLRRLFQLREKYAVELQEAQAMVRHWNLRLEVLDEIMGNIAVADKSGEVGADGITA